jgi:hypothetical protein
VTALRELEGELTTITYGEGVTFPAVMFVCPVCSDGHSHMIPYTDEPFHEVPDPRGGRQIKLWQRTSGTTIDDLTLSPSYLVPSCNLHGYVRDGRWVPC